MKRHIRVRRPESHQEELRLVYFTRHHCPQGDALAKAGEEDPDALLFPIGYHGGAMPTGTAFPVPAHEPCPACGDRPTIWAEWLSPTIIDMGASDEQRT